MARMLRIAPTEHGGYSHDNLKSTRHIVLPNGQSMLISLENRCWAALDWLINERGFDMDDIVPVVYQEARQYHNLLLRSFLEQMPISFKGVIMNYAYWEMNGARGVANQY